MLDYQLAKLLTEVVVDVVGSILIQSCFDIFKEFLV